MNIKCIYKFRSFVTQVLVLSFVYFNMNMPVSAEINNLTKDKFYDTSFIDNNNMVSAMDIANLQNNQAEAVSPGTNVYDLPLIPFKVDLHSDSKECSVDFKDNVLHSTLITLPSNYISDSLKISEKNNHINSFTIDPSSSNAVIVNLSGAVPSEKTEYIDVKDYKVTLRPDQTVPDEVSYPITGDEDANGYAGKVYRNNTPSSKDIIQGATKNVTMQINKEENQDGFNLNTSLYYDKDGYTGVLHYQGTQNYSNATYSGIVKQPDTYGCSYYYDSKKNADGTTSVSRTAYDYHYEVTVDGLLNDDCGNDISSACDISNYSEVNGKINYENDIDCFKFVPSSSGNYIFSTTHNLNNVKTFGRLLDSDGKLILSNSNADPNYTGFTIVKNLVKGQSYYLQVSGENNAMGSYSINIAQSYDDRARGLLLFTGARPDYQQYTPEDITNFLNIGINSYVIQVYGSYQDYKKYGVNAVADQINTAKVIDTITQIYKNYGLKAHIYLATLPLNGLDKTNGEVFAKTTYTTSFDQNTYNADTITNYMSDIMNTNIDNKPIDKDFVDGIYLNCETIYDNGSIKNTTLQKYICDTLSCLSDRAKLFGNGNGQVVWIPYFSYPMFINKLTSVHGKLTSDEYAEITKMVNDCKYISVQPHTYFSKFAKVINFDGTTTEGGVSGITSGLNWAQAVTKYQQIVSMAHYPCTTVIPNVYVPLKSNGQFGAEMEMDPYINNYYTYTDPNDPKNSITDYNYLYIRFKEYVDMFHDNLSTTAPVFFYADSENAVSVNNPNNITNYINAFLNGGTIPTAPINNGTINTGVPY